jgi:hypothetical protein
MIKLTDIYSSVNALLNSKYPTYKRYGHEVTEGFSKPSFFVDLIPKIGSNEGINYKSYAYTIMITYFQSKVDEIDNLTKADEIKELFGYMMTVGTRKIPIKDFSYEFVGEKSNILQTSAEIEYFETNEKADTSIIATEIILNEEKR